MAVQWLYWIADEADWLDVWQIATHPLRDPNYPRIDPLRIDPDTRHTLDDRIQRWQQTRDVRIRHRNGNAALTAAIAQAMHRYRLSAVSPADGP